MENSEPKLKILIEPSEFLPKLSLLKDEMMKMKGAIDGQVMTVMTMMIGQ